MADSRATAHRLYVHDGDVVIDEATIPNWKTVLGKPREYTFLLIARADRWRVSHVCDGSVAGGGAGFDTLEAARAHFDEQTAGHARPMTMF